MIMQYWRGICAATLLVGVLGFPVSGQAQDWYGVGTNVKNDYGLEQNSILNTPTLVPDAPVYTDVSAGNMNYLAVDTENNVYSGGFNKHGRVGAGFDTLTGTTSEPYLLFANTPVRDLEAGCNANAIVKADGSLWMWGLSENLQLTDTYAANQTEPVEVIPSGIVDVSVECSRTVAVTETGEVLSWGIDYDERGVLGLGTATFSQGQPAVVSGVSDVQAVVAKNKHTCALTNAQEVYCWGHNDSGQLGTGDTTDSAVPVQSLASGIVQLSESRFPATNLALSASGEVYVWGAGETTPTQVPGLSGITRVDSAGQAYYALDSLGDVYVWGTNTYGLYGEGQDEGGSTATPTKHSTLADITLITGGNYAAYAVNTSGELSTWGMSDYGQTLADTPNTGSDVPEVQTQLADFDQVYLGANHRIAKTTDGQVYAWGENIYGQLGTGDTTAREQPVAVSGFPAGTEIISVAANGNNSYALDRNGGVWAWGRDRLDLLLQETSPGADALTPLLSDELSNVTQISAKLSRFFALDTDGTLVAYGSNNVNVPALGNGQAGTEGGPFTVLADVAAVEAGTETTLALKQDGTVWVAGRNGQGALGLDSEDDRETRASFAQIPGLTGVATISNNVNTSAVLTSGGELYAWGNNFNQTVALDRYLGVRAPLRITPPAGETIADIATYNRDVFVSMESREAYRRPALWETLPNVAEVTQFSEGFNHNTDDIGIVAFLYGQASATNQAYTPESIGELAMTCDPAIERRPTNCTVTVPTSFEKLQNVRMGLGTDQVGGVCAYAGDVTIECSEVPVGAANTPMTNTQVQAVDGNIYFQANLQPVTVTPYTSTVYSLQDDPDNDGLTIEEELARGSDPFGAEVEADQDATEVEDEEVGTTPNTNLIRTGGA